MRTVIRRRTQPVEAKQNHDTATTSNKRRSRRLAGIGMRNRTQTADGKTDPKTEYHVGGSLFQANLDSNRGLSPAGWGLSPAGWGLSPAGWGRWDAVDLCVASVLLVLFSLPANGAMGPMGQRRPMRRIYPNAPMALIGPVLPRGDPAPGYRGLAAVAPAARLRGLRRRITWAASRC